MNIVIRAVEGRQLAVFRAWAAKYPERIEQRDRLLSFMEIDLMAAPPPPVEPEDRAGDRLERLKTSLADTIETMKTAIAEASALVEAHEPRPVPAPPVVEDPVEPAPVPSPRRVQRRVRAVAKRAPKQQRRRTR